LAHQLVASHIFAINVEHFFLFSLCLC